MTLWFVMGGVAWLPLLYLAYSAGSLPFVGSLAAEYSELFFSAGFVTLWVFTVGSGLFYYTLVKELDIPLASRQLASVGFWSLGFAAAWWGSAQLVFGPGPGWIDAVSAALGLAFPIGALANAANASLTLQGHWERVAGQAGCHLRRRRPLPGWWWSAILASSPPSPPSDRSPHSPASGRRSNTWPCTGSACCSSPGVVFEALPRMSGRRAGHLDRPRSFNR